jgi:hypothetical protein
VQYLRVVLGTSFAAENVNNFSLYVLPFPSDIAFVLMSLCIIVII